MNSSYTQVVIYLFLSLVGINKSLANTFAAFLFDCNTDTLSLCVEDEGVRLPINNKIYLGENHPDATSCSVHVSQSIKVQPDCPGVVQYEVQIFLFDAGESIILQSGASAVIDSLGEAELFFDSELSTDTSISQDGIPYTTGCERYHRIKWIVTDSCGQVSVCEKLVDLYDCSHPILIISPDPLIKNVPVGGLLTFYQNDIIVESNDDCTFNQDFLLSYSEEFYSPELEYDPCDAPAFGVVFPFGFWIAGDGRDLNCNDTIEWHERDLFQEHINLVVTDNTSIHCGDGGKIIGGEIITEDIQSVSQVKVSLLSPGHLFPVFVTVEDGKYNFSNLIVPEDFTIKAERDDLHRNGVSTLDLVKIQKHLLGKEWITSPYDLIAADANNSNSVSAIDLVESRKLILGRYTEFPLNESWRFVPKNFIFSDSTYPWPFPEEISFILTETMTNVDFIAIKIGDVNNTVQANVTGILPRDSPPLIKVKTPQKNYTKNEIMEIPISLNELKEIQGFQFTISSPDLEFVSATSNTIDIKDEHYSLFGDKLTMSWFDEDGVAFDKDDVIFTLKVIAKKNGSLKTGFTMNSEITNAEVYSMQDEIFTPQLFIIDDSKVNSPTLMPNPWKEQTTVAINLIQDGKTEIEILDLSGRIVYSETKYLIKGNNEIVLESKNFEARGLMMYSITNGNEVLTAKMIVLD